MKQRFLTGLIVVLPAAITIWLLSWIVHLVTKPFTEYTELFLARFNLFQDGWWFFSQERMLHATTTLVILVGLCLGLFLVGFISRYLFLNVVWKWIERPLLKVPFISGLYRVCRDFTGILFSSKKSSFKRVVWYPFPSSEQKTMALVTNEITLATDETNSQDYVSVFLPGTPNPTVGFLLICPKKLIEEVNVPIDTALKWVISCGSSEVQKVLSPSQDVSEKIFIEKKV